MLRLPNIMRCHSQCKYIAALLNYASKSKYKLIIWVLSCMLGALPLYKYTLDTTLFIYLNENKDPHMCLCFYPSLEIGLKDAIDVTCSLCVYPRYAFFHRSL